ECSVPGLGRHPPETIARQDAVRVVREAAPLEPCRHVCRDPGEVRVDLLAVLRVREPVLLIRGERELATRARPEGEPGPRAGCGAVPLDREVEQAGSQRV